MGSTLSAAKDAYNGLSNCTCEESRDPVEASDAGTQSACHSTFKEEVETYIALKSNPDESKGSSNHRFSLQHCIICNDAPIGKVTQWHFYDDVSVDHSALSLKSTLQNANATALIRLQINPRSQHLSSMKCCVYWQGIEPCGHVCVCVKCALTIEGLPKKS